MPRPGDHTDALVSTCTLSGRVGRRLPLQGAEGSGVDKVPLSIIGMGLADMRRASWRPTAPCRGSSVVSVPTRRYCVCMPLGHPRSPQLNS